MLMIQKHKQQGPRTIGYTLDNAVQVVDIFGERLTLPWQFCSSWEVRHIITGPVGHLADHSC
jgi:hypothetical protein